MASTRWSSPAKEKRRFTPGELERRRQEALAVAERCAVILREQFGARRVIPFGSLISGDPWHESSDLDLAAGAHERTSPQ